LIRKTRTNTKSLKLSPISLRWPMAVVSWRKRIPAKIVKIEANYPKMST
jgi:hypothetical protein